MKKKRKNVRPNSIREAILASDRTHSGQEPVRNGKKKKVAR